MPNLDTQRTAETLPRMAASLVPRELLTDHAINLIGNGKASARSHGLENSLMGAMVIGRIARRGVMAKTRGHYPAVPRALDVVLAGLRTSPAQSIQMAVGMRRERVAKSFWRGWSSTCESAAIGSV